MCGIFGLIQGKPFSARELAGMSRVIRHRGPDDEGFAFVEKGNVRLFGGVDTPSTSFDARVSYCPKERLPQSGEIGTGGVVLGHRRLSILDLSPRGHQPMSFQDRYWIAYNGEVYNYLELREELRSLGYRFTTDSDTEVILAAYDRWGSGCLSRFNGMWAIAIVDTIASTLFLARDRFGVKPLYLRQHGGRLAFASEIKAFTALEDWVARANRDKLLDMLVWNISDHTHATMFEDVTQLPAGHFLTIDLAPPLSSKSPLDIMAKHSPQRWYNISESKVPLRGNEAAQALHEVLDDAVRLRLRSDVPVGSCLSGGLDSSTIVCLMGRQLHAQNRAEQLRTFTARSHDAEFDESKYAQVAGARAGAIAHEVTPEPMRLFEDLERLSWHQDEPFVSTSIFAQWCVFNQAREAGVTVMLDGQGADEILCGYRGYFGAYLAGLIRGASPMKWLSELGAMRREINFSYLRSAGYTAAYLFPRFVGWIGRLDNRAYADRDWLAKTAHDAFECDPLHSLGARAASVRAMSTAQLMATNLPMLLHWEDRNSMAFSVEARVPFLDYRVVELCVNMPDAEKIGGGISKAVLRRSMRGIVPDVILDRRDKLGFVTAERLWATRDMAAQFRTELVDAVESLDQLLSSRIIDQFDQVVDGRKPFDHRYWRAISAGRWARAFNVST